MNEPRSLLVTGASGFIGAPLCRALTAAGHRVTGLRRADGDIADAATLRGRDRVDHVFHLAGRTFVPDSWTDPQGFQHTNVMGTINVLDYCRAHGASLTFVSAYLYGVPERLPIAETAVPRPNNPYALSKHLAEQACAFYAERYGVPVIVLRPFNVYGPGQPSHFLIPQIVADVRAGRVIRVKDLEPRRDYLHLDDLVSALVGTTRPDRGCRVLNLGSGYSLSVREVIAAIQQAAGTTLPVETLNEPRRDELDDVYAAIDEAARVLGWTPRISFADGLASLMTP